MRHLSHPRHQRLLAALVAVALLSAGSARADGPRPDCYVLSVGVDAYSHPKVPRLKGCVTDAQTAAQTFRRQEGRLFGKVAAWTLTDVEATRPRILQEMAALRSAGKPGDFCVLFLSGHGGRRNPAWYFLPSDYNPENGVATGLDDTIILAFADNLAAGGRKVLVIIDACFAGQLRLRGKNTLDRYQDPRGGGIVLMLSSTPGQTSQALGQYSAYAQAVAEGLSGQADLNRDGKVTLGEVRRYAYARVYDMLKQRGMKKDQDGECDYSPSLSETLVLAYAGPPASNGNAVHTVASSPVSPPPAPPAAIRTWTYVGSEDLQDYGALTFQLASDGSALMTDARTQVRGNWAQDGPGGLAIRFQNCVYRGRFNGPELAGQAQFTGGPNDGQAWSFRVALKQN